MRLQLHHLCTLALYYTWPLARYHIIKSGTFSEIELTCVIHAALFISLGMIIIRVTISISIVSR